MCVYKARHDNVSACIDYLAAFGHSQSFAYFRDTIAVDEDIDTRQIIRRRAGTVPGNAGRPGTVLRTDHPEAVLEQDHLSISALKSLIIVSITPTWL